MAGGLVLSFATADRLQTIFDRAGGGQDALGRYAAIFEHAVTAPHGSTRLRGLLDRLSAEGHPAPVCMRQLNRILGFGELRRGAAILHFPVQAVTLWDFYVLFALERWRRGERPPRPWLARRPGRARCAGAARHRTSRQRELGGPSRSMPVDDVTADAIGHPLIPDERRVANDVTVGPRGTVLLITGSNMSGKSTLLRSIGLNIVLAQAWRPVCATRMIPARVRSPDEHPRPGLARARPVLLHGGAGTSQGRRRRRRSTSARDVARVPARRDPAGHQQHRAQPRRSRGDAASCSRPARSAR